MSDVFSFGEISIHFFALFAFSSLLMYFANNFFIFLEKDNEELGGRKNNCKRLISLAKEESTVT